MRQLVSKFTIGAALLFGVSSVGMSSVALQYAHAGQAVDESAKACHSEPFAWSGNVGLAPGETFSTGVGVDQQLGQQSTVISFAVSTGEGSPSAMLVRIGDAVAGNGADVSGGAIAVSNNGAAAVHVTSVDLIVAQCQFVAVGDAPSLQSSGFQSSSLRASEAPLLPATGAGSRLVALGGLVTISLGTGLVVLARRRRVV